MVRPRRPEDGGAVSSPRRVGLQAVLVAEDFQPVGVRLPFRARQRASQTPIDMKAKARADKKRNW